MLREGWEGNFTYKLKPANHNKPTQISTWLHTFLHVISSTCPSDLILTISTILQAKRTQLREAP